jgi:putative alpha-1,2-mannosidase
VPSVFGQDGYDEGNAEQYVWWVPHSVAGLVTALGGRGAVAGRLDRFTEELNVGPNEPYLWAGNEPGFGVPWLYNYVGQPWKT